MKRNNFLLIAIATLSAFILSSCGGQKNLLIPHSISTARPVTVDDLRLTRSDYTILNTVTETASVIVEYRNNEVRINSGEGMFSYKFKFDNSNGWSLASFSGIATMGYFTDDLDTEPSSTPQPEEFARRAAMAKVISAAQDFHADGIVEPTINTVAENIGNNKVQFTTTVRAKLIVLSVNN